MPQPPKTPTYPTGASDTFDADFSIKRRKLAAQMQANWKKLATMNANGGTAVYRNEIMELASEQLKLKRQILDLIPIDVATFREYENKLLDNVSELILGDAFMSDCILRWPLLDATTRTQFGTILLDGLDKKYRERDAQTQLVMREGTAPSGSPRASYNWDDHKIYMYAGEYYMKNTDDFIGVLLHEFMHYVSHMHPLHHPLGAQYAHFAKQDYLFMPPGGATNAEQMALYKYQPYERYSYMIQDTVRQRKLGEMLARAIQTRQSGPYVH